MKKQYLKLIIPLAALSLIGIVCSQTFWLKKSAKTLEMQFDDRADRMLSDVRHELHEYAENSPKLQNIPVAERTIFDVIDTAALEGLFHKYCLYHRLDTNYHFALVHSSNLIPIVASIGYTPEMEKEAYKACLSRIWKKEYLHLAIYFPNKVRNIYMQMMSWIILSVVFLIIITGAFIYIIYGYFRQKKITEIKNDFINNMTHEFKTPISTISLASEILIKNAHLPVNEKISKYSKIIFDENQRMRQQVELVLQTALFERGQMNLRKEMVDIHELLQTAVESFALEISNKKAAINYYLRAVNPMVSIDSAHIRNVISNIVDNAMKYSGQTPKIDLLTENLSNGIRLTVVDNGIGMNREAQRLVFDKFYRVSTGNVHTVKGFGLGLYYVKTIIDAHQGSVSVQSALNNGSTFHVFLPQ